MTADFSVLLEQVRARLAALEPEALEIVDESHLHAGHAGAQNGARHLRLRIRSAQFNGKLPLARHRLVYDILAGLIPYPIHALAIDAQPGTIPNTVPDKEGSTPT